MTSTLFLTEAIYCNIFRCIYHRNEKCFVNFFLHFVNLLSILNILKKKMTLIADTFLNLRTLKYIVREMSKKFRLRGAFDKWDGKQDETLLKSERQHPYHIYWSLWRKLELKKSLWAICSVWGLFVNPLTAHDKYSLLKVAIYCNIFRCIYLKDEEHFVNFFWTFSKFRVNFEDLQKKGDPHSRCIFEFTDSEIHRYRNVWKVSFQRTLWQMTW